MRVAIVGSRTYPRLADVGDFVRTLPKGSVVISGGAIGVDRAAETVAKVRGIPAVIFPARWAELGRGAGMVRNGEIIANSDLVVAFWDMESRGTLDTIKKALRAGKPVYVNTHEDW